MDISEIPNFEDIPIDIDLDTKSNGGIIRLKTIKDLKTWANKERKFWEWMRNDYGSRSILQNTELASKYNSFLESIEQKYHSAQQSFTNIKSIIESKLNQLNNEVSTGKREAQENEITQSFEKLQRICKSEAQEIRNLFEKHLVKEISYFPSASHAAKFIHKIHANSKNDAIFALDELLKAKRGNIESNPSEFSGRFQALTYFYKLKELKPISTDAFESMTEKWNHELSSYKSEYAKLDESLNNQKNEQQKIIQSLNDKQKEMTLEFSKQIEENQADLTALKETYDSFMQLHAASEYWASKKKEHVNGKKLFARLVALSSVLGGVFIYFTALNILPESTASDIIPWRNLGIFALMSTISFWVIRLCTKLMLSHIHLYADAREREVMISTFLALLRRDESRETLKNSDIALVLAPIFRPSTTGVIKDDGGPLSLSEMIVRMGDVK